MGSGSRVNNGLRDFGRKGGEVYLIPLDDIELDENYRAIDLTDPEERAALDTLKANIKVLGVLNAGLARMDAYLYKIGAFNTEADELILTPATIPARYVRNAMIALYGKEDHRVKNLIPSDPSAMGDAA